MQAIALGIDIGGTNTSVAFVNQQGEILERFDISSQVHSHFDSFVKEIYTKASSYPMTKQLIGIGIGAPNGNYYNGTIEFAPNLIWDGVLKVKETFEKYFSLPTVLTNDANAAAIGEQMFGAAKGMKNFAMITLGTGVGSGIVISDQMLYGADGFAGEVGHTIVEENGRMCGCGRKGCLETYSSVTGLKRTVIEMIQKGNDSELKNFGMDNLSGKIIEKAACSGDTVALEAFEKTGEYLGKAMANLIAILSPEAIILFGGLAQAKELIFKPTQYHMEANLLNIFKDKVKLLPSDLEGNDAAVLGAAALIFKELKNTH